MGYLMGRKKKVNKMKLVSRMLLLIIILIMIIFLLNVVLKKSDTNVAEFTLILDNKDITESLQKSIYIDKDKKLYMAVEDIKNIFDKDIYFEEETGKLITTSGTNVGAIDVNNDTFELNSATLALAYGVIKYDTGYYIPISEVTNIYNIEVWTTENSAVISSLYKELTTVKTTKKVSLKKDTSFFSNTLQKLENEKELIFIENAEKAGWIKVLTHEGKIGYVKEKNVGSKENIRTNMSESDFSSKSADVNNAIELNKKVIISDNMKDFNSRKKTVEDIISNIISKEKYTVNINLKDVDLEEKLIERFIIELMPRLKEIGGSIVVTNNSILNSTFISENNL